MTSLATSSRTRPPQRTRSAITHRPVPQRAPIPGAAAARPAPPPAMPGATPCRADLQEDPVTATDLFALLERLETTDIVPCRVHDAELWFPQAPEDVAFAKALCGTCPAVRVCLAHALAAEVWWGVWGGELFERGMLVATKRPRGRPRKETVAA